MRRLEFSAEGGSRQREQEWERRSGSPGVRNAVLAAAVLVAGGLYSRDQGQPFLRAPGTVNFGAVNVGAAGLAAAIPLRNAGLGRLQIGTVAASGAEAADYTIANDGCSGVELGPGEACLIDVQFEAAGAGLRMAELRVEFGAASSGRTIGLRGEGVHSLAARVVPGRLDFGGQRVGTTSPIQLARLRNESANPFRVESVEWREFAEDFQIVHENCSSNELEAGGECEIGVEFTPISEGPRSAIVAIGTINSEGFMLQLDGSGVGVEATVVEIFPRTIDFGAKDPTETLPPRSVTIHVSGAEPVSVQGARIEPDLAGFTVEGDECSGRVLSDGQECSLQVRFDQNEPGEHLARLEVGHSRSDAAEIISVHGEVRRVTNWSVQVSPESVNFGEQTIGAAPGSRVVQLKNLSTEALDLDRTTLETKPPGAVAIANDGCGGRQFVPNGGCEVRLSFEPRSAGAYRARLRFNFRSPLPSRDVEVLGTAKVPPRQPVARLAVDPVRIDFGARPPKERSQVQTVTVSNKGDDDAAITATRTTGLDAPDFAVRGNQCAGRNLGAGQSCRIEVDFVGKIAGKRLAALEIANDSGSGPLAVSLNGEVTRVLKPAQLSLRPGRVVFPAVKPGDRSPREFLVISNEGELPGTVRSVRLGGANPASFAAGTEGCNGRTLGPGENCRIQVAFVGRQPGPSTATIEVEHDGAGPALTAVIAGEIIRLPDPARFVVRPVSVIFPPRNEGDRPQGSVVTVLNEGQSPARILSTGIVGANPNDFAVANQDCDGQTIAPGRQCRIEVVLVRREAGVVSAALEIRHDAPGAASAVSLSGEVLRPAPPPSLQFVPGRLSMGPYRIGERPGTDRLALVNDGLSPARVGAIRFEGANARDFAVVNENCSGRVLASGERCSVEVTFTGSQAGDHVAGLVATYDGPGGAATAVLQARLERAPSLSGPPEFITRPPQLSFQISGVGSSVPPQEVAVFNVGESPGRITGVRLLGNDGNVFAVLNDGCRGARIAPNGSCRILVSLSARTLGNGAAVLQVNHDAPGPALQVRLYGSVNQPPAQPPRLRIVPSALRFDNQAAGTTSAPAAATVTNEGGAGALIRGVQVRGQFAQEFRTIQDSCSGRPLPPGGNCAIAIVFSPRGAGARPAELAVSHEGGPEAAARLSGVGFLRVPPGGFEVYNPGNTTLAQPQKVCPDPAAVLFRPSLVRRDSDYAGTVRLQGALRNEGDTFQSRMGQQSLQIVEVPPGGGGGRVLQNVPFGSLQSGQTVAISTNIQWSLANEFPPSYRLVIAYDPDISNDSNPANDDCNGRNNVQSINSAQISALFSATRPQVQPRVPPQLRRQPAPRIN